MASRLDHELHLFVEELGATIGKLQRRVEDLDARLAASEEATVQLCLELERRVGVLEQRQKPDRPKLLTIIDVDDAAD